MKPLSKLAFCGIFTAFGVILLLMTGLFPMAEFALPAIAGLLPVVLVIESEKKYAFLVFFATAVLGAILCPLKESALYYAAFLGFYPIVKSTFEQCKSRITEWLCKISLFAVMAVLIVAAGCFLGFFSAAAIFAMGIPLLCGSSLLFLAAFVVYDVAVSRLISGYLFLLRPRISRFFH